MSTALAFQNTSFDVVDQTGSPWLQARQIGTALGYSRPDAVLNLYERNRDEFSPAMTRTIELMVGGQQCTIRIFSLRGCHLLAMFARTPVAKAFRAWVLDVLETLGETESTQPTPRLATKQERKPLVDLVRLWVSMAPLGYRAAFRQVNTALGVSTVEEMTPAMVLRAIGWVQARIDAAQSGQRALPEPEAHPMLPQLEDDLRRALHEDFLATDALGYRIREEVLKLRNNGWKKDELLARRMSPLFQHSMNGYLARERIMSSISSIESEGLKAIEAGMSCLLMVTRLREGLAAMR